MDITLCVDALEPQLGGIGRYTWELCKGVPGRKDVSSVRYFAGHRLIDDPLMLLRGERVRRGRGVVRAARAWRARRALRSTLVHAPNYFLPRAAESGVVTVHDLSVFRYPETHPAARLRQFEAQLPSSLDRSARVITDTQTVRDELIEMFGVSPGKISVVPLGVSERFRPFDQAELAVSLAKWGFRPGAYGLCVSALEPRKKVAELLSAWARLPRPVRDAVPLVLAGGKGWMNERLHERVKTAVAEGWLRYLAFVAEEDLPSLYAGAALFVYPSIYEGFGLPPLEAMASGVPVIVSDRSCMPEVCGDAALYVNPEDDDAFLSTIRGALENPELRQTAIERGLARAARFTWKRCVEDTVAVYRHLAHR